MGVKQITHRICKRNTVFRTKLYIHIYGINRICYHKTDNNNIFNNSFLSLVSIHQWYIRNAQINETYG